MAAVVQAPTLPISEISTYHPKWTIRARVTNKSNLRTFSKGGGAGGKVFSCDLLDAEGGEIRASFFNEAVDNFADKIQVGKCYSLSRGSVKIANRQFNNCNHRYEIVFDKGADVVEVSDDVKIEAMKFSFTDLRTLKSKTLPASVDLCGVIVSFLPAHSFTSQQGKDLTKREITIADDTANSITVTVWGDKASQEDKNFAGNPTIALKGVLVKEWKEGRSGSLLASGALQLQPSFPEVQRVQRWWSEGGKDKGLTALSLAGGEGGGMRTPTGKAATIAEMRAAADRILGQNTEIFSIVCRLALVQTRKQGEVQPLHYMACLEPKQGNNLPCNKRIDASGHCAACDRIVGKSAPRFNLRCKFSDFGDCTWLTTFHEAAGQVLGMKAEEAQALETGEGGREALEIAIRERYFSQPMQVTARAKLDSFNGEPRTNITCIDARPVSRGEHGRAMLKEIGELLAAASESSAQGGA